MSKVQGAWLFSTTLLLVLLKNCAANEVALQGTSPRMLKKHILTNTTSPILRCSHVTGDWCKDFHEQTPIPWKPAPRGSKACPNDCSGHGTCNADTGICMCPAGWQGDDCNKRLLRSCTKQVSTCESGWAPEPMSNIDENGKDLTPYEYGHKETRCSGVCEPELGLCFCDGPKGFIPAPKGSPPGTPPVRRARAMVTPEFQLKYDKAGKELGFGGTMAWDDMYGPRGWCVADAPDRTIPCILDGAVGQYCDEQVEMFCINQCSGRGTCWYGFCNCDTGWYGTDCSMPAVNTDPSIPSRLASVPHLAQAVIEPPSAMQTPPAATRKKPLIYIYDLEPMFNTKLLQYRLAGTWCSHRKWESHNTTFEVPNWGYSVEQLLHETLVQSPHRTYDPEEADFFYVPFYASCLIYPVQGQADIPRFAPFESPRVAHAALGFLEVQKWIDDKFPYWKRRDGRDHIFLFTHDEGACWAPNSVTNAIWLTHWGRMDLDHKSHTAFAADNYEADKICKATPQGWTKFIKGHVCYNASKDLVIPAHRPQTHYGRSPLMGQAPKQRDLLLFFRGDVGEGRDPRYSRGIRQKLFKMSKEHNWKEKYQIVIGGRNVPGTYSELLARSKFCLVAPGDGWSPRLEDSILHGCIPLIIKDNVHDAFESILDFSQFAVRVAEADVERVPEILLGISNKQLTSLQHHLARVWHRFRWANAHFQQSITQHNLDRNLQQYDAQRELAKQQHIKSGVRQRHLASTHDDGHNSTSRVLLLPRPFRGDVRVDDAFSTIMQWLYGRIEATR